MPLLEIIKGEKTTDETLYRALDVAKQIKKTPIVVNDSRGFFTSRVIGTFINEGIAMLTEGVPAPTIEQASSQAGYPAPVLQLMRRAQPEADAQDPQRRRRRPPRPRAPAGPSTRPTQVIDRMLDEFDRPGKLEGKGFYEYEDGKRTGLWPGLREAFPPVGRPVDDLAARPRGAHAVHRGASRRSSASTRASSRRSPTPTSARSWASASRAGPAACSSTSTATRAASPASSRARASWPRTYGERFEPPASLVEKAERGEIYSDDPVAVPA